MEKVGEAYPDLPAAMTPHFLVKSTREGSSRRPITAGDRIRRALAPEDMRAYKQANDKRLIGWHYAFADFVSNL